MEEKIKKISFLLIFLLVSFYIIATPVKIFININEDCDDVWLVLRGYEGGSTWNPYTTYSGFVDLVEGLNIIDDPRFYVAADEVPMYIGLEAVSSSSYHYSLLDNWYDFIWSTDPIDHWANYNDQVDVTLELGPDATLFIQTNSDVEECTVDLYNSTGYNVGSETISLDNNDYDNDGSNEIEFDHISFIYDDEEDMYAVANGTDVYNDNQTESTQGTPFVYNESTERWENDIALNYTFPDYETRTFLPGWNWASCPRLYRTGNNGFPAEVVIDDLEPFALWIQSENQNEYMQFFLPDNWVHHNGFYDFFSTSGYKIDMNEEYATYDLNVYGTVLAPDTEMLLTGGGEENWIGYFLPYSLFPSQAFAQIWDSNLYQIKGQDWSMWKINGKWYGSNERYTIDYGDMVIAKCNTNCAFRWDTEEPVNPRDREKTEHYTYEEQADYIPILVELEEGDEPLEIGVMVNGECMGAAKVDGESVQLNAYILEGHGEDVEFDKYYGRSNPETTCKKYKVFDPVINKHISRKIKAGEYSDFYMVTLDNSAEDQSDLNEIIQLYHSPNPFSSSVNISYQLPVEQHISLEIYNIKGQKIKTLYSGISSAGDHKTSWDATDDNNDSVSSGVYLYKLITPTNVISRRLMLMK